jgi:uncharacterized membrane-anchored protein
VFAELLLFPSKGARMKKLWIYLPWAVLSMLAPVCNIHAAEEPATEQQQELTAEQQQYLERIGSLWESVERKTGDVQLPGDIATLKLGDKFYYLSPADTEKVLVDIWGNPPGGKTYGMLFPAGSTPFNDSWAVTIEYEEEGYVSDADAADIDYAEMLGQMKKDTKEYSKERLQQGYEAVELIGWAANPHYDANSKKLYWAKELKFGDQEQHSLNYNIRVLGRKGVLVMNFIAGMNQLAEVDANVEPVLALAEFNQGFRYQDFNPDLDKVAAYGIGALVAGKILAKTGLIAIALLALKKFWIFLILGIGAAFRALFRGKKSTAVNE